LDPGKTTTPNFIGIYLIQSYNLSVNDSSFNESMKGQLTEKKEGWG
jgi:hypothetical protein